MSSGANLKSKLRRHGAQRWMMTRFPLLLCKWHQVLCCVVSMDAACYASRLICSSVKCRQKKHTKKTIKIRTIYRICIRKETYALYPQRPGWKIGLHLCCAVTTATVREDHTGAICLLRRGKKKKNNDRIQIFIYNRCHEFITEVRFVQRTEYKPSSLTVYHQIHNHKSKPSQRKRWRKQDALGECTDESVSSLYYSVTMFKVWCWHSNNAFLGGLTKTSSNLRQRTSMLNGKLLRHRNWLKWLSISEFAVFVSVEEPVKRAGAEYQTIFRTITTSMRPQCQCGEWEMTWPHTRGKLSPCSTAVVGLEWERVSLFGRVVRTWTGSPSRKHIQQAAFPALSV